MKSRDELTLDKSLIRLKSNSSVPLELILSQAREGFKWEILETYKVANEVNLEKLDGIGPSREFP